MSDYKARDFYGPEAVRQVETTNALQAQLEMKYAQFKARAAALPEGPDEILEAKIRGYELALEDLTHAAGTTLAHLYGEEKWGRKHKPQPEALDNTPEEKL